MKKNNVLILLVTILGLIVVILYFIVLLAGLGTIVNTIKENNMMLKALYNQIEAPLKVLGGS